MKKRRDELAAVRAQITASLKEKDDLNTLLKKLSDAVKAQVGVRS